MPVAVMNAAGDAVEMLLRDVHDIGAAAEKYGLDKARLVLGEHAPGTGRVGGVFTLPPRPPRPPRPKAPPDPVKALRAVARRLGLPDVEIDGILEASANEADNG